MQYYTHSKSSNYRGCSAFPDMPTEAQGGRNYKAIMTPRSFYRG